MTARKKYSKEFKLDPINLVLEQNYTRAAASRSLGLNPNVDDLSRFCAKASYKNWQSCIL
jgi:transposase-like protein